MAELESDHDKAVNKELDTDIQILENAQRLDDKRPVGKKRKKDPVSQLIKMKEDAMKEAVKVLDFETAAILRDELVVLNKRLEDKNKK